MKAYSNKMTATVQTSKQTPTIFVKVCMVCGETVCELDPKFMEYHRYYGEPEICDKCKQAIKAMRKQIEEEKQDDK